MSQSASTTQSTRAGADAKLFATTHHCPLVMLTVVYGGPVVLRWAGWWWVWAWTRRSRAWRCSTWPPCRHWPTAPSTSSTRSSRLDTRPSTPSTSQVRGGLTAQDRAVGRGVAEDRVWCHHHQPWPWWLHAGGLSKSPLFVREHADVLGRKLILPRVRRQTDRKERPYHG